MLQKIINCYDSHTHFWATGQVAEGLRLEHLKSISELATLKIEKTHFRSNWLVGFGWNQNNWSPSAFPTCYDLDTYFPDTPVFFSRVDGHASWINSYGIKELTRLGFNFSQDISGGIIHRDVSGKPNGILLDQSHIQALMMLPDFTEAQHIQFFKRAQNIFNLAGFTHIRDLSMHGAAWSMLRKLEDNKELTVCVEAFVTTESLTHLDSVFGTIEEIKKDPSQQMRLHGVKIFIDGSLGSKSAYLSQNYLNSDSNGLLIWNFEEIKSAITRSWQKGYQVAIHCIGDLAAATAVKAAREVSATGVLGRLHLEHVQLLSFETVQMMKPLHVTCYMQPCHWLSDHSWLKNVLPQSLMPSLFQWELLRRNKIPFFFGSDSPIEKPSLFTNQMALQLSAKNGVTGLSGDWLTYHQHPDKSWCPSFTEIIHGEVKQVYFRGEALF